MTKSKKILLVLSSPNKESLSSAVATFSAKKLIEKYPNSELTVLDLNNSPFSSIVLNSFNRDTFFADTESDLWIQKLKETNILIIAAPMTNFNFPATLKNFIDSIAVAEKTFTYKYATKGASKGLLDKLNVFIIATQGAPKGWYPFGDHVRMLKGTFKFLGAKKVGSVLIDGTKVKPRNSMTFDQIISEIESELNNEITKF
ncbi:FMN-dependent NADH-azoreductase [Mycoplasma tauri]|uniref:FMN dependent NADH:quinone oxidoreductase n=1 Tax=Mycoplasma tauri TaxID=547987 RepID=A0A953NC23_9MOLU|nr:FMN-dependent NADH-azoreductase [Mycoplasma tauri]MBZ4195117.1 FMN-dependent NADH-azoreductase [Mycoplasma tauri]MBZ4226841.1 FMN-dependent NADH-azoreductase [Mycoplasma tauri]QSB07731.1 FMN-dependent NADH-azoreductase [Mycoplasma tauri]